ncbi:MAG: flippase-like domain-containing protein [Ignavibacteriaceae bacterium]|nr:flippase-like domain-containing protein [Ignavibacteriaceae bacterium]
MLNFKIGAISKKRLTATFGLVLQIATGILAFYWVIRWSGISFDQFRERAVQVSPILISLGILSFILTALLNALRYRLFLQGQISIRYLTGLFLVQNALLTITPWRVGELSYPILLHRDYRISLARSGTALLLIRILDLSIFVFNS